MCLKRPAFDRCPLYLFIFLPCDYVTQLEKEKTCSRGVLLVTERLENSTCSWFFSSGFFRGRWMQRRGWQRDVTTQCEMGFKPMLLWLHGLRANGLKAPWQLSVFQSSSTQLLFSPNPILPFYCFSRATCNVSPPLGLPPPYLSRPLMVECRWFACHSLPWQQCWHIWPWTMLGFEPITP